MILAKSSPRVWMTRRPQTHKPIEIPIPPYISSQIGMGILEFTTWVTPTIHRPINGPMALLFQIRKDERGNNWIHFRPPMISVHKSHEMQIAKVIFKESGQGVRCCLWQFTLPRNFRSITIHRRTKQFNLFSFYFAQFTKLQEMPQSYLQFDIICLLLCLF